MSNQSNEVLDRNKEALRYSDTRLQTVDYINENTNPKPRIVTGGTCCLCQPCGV